MKRHFQAAGRAREVELRRAADGSFEAVVDGVPLPLGAVPLGDGFLRLDTAQGPVLACVSRDGRRRFVTLGGRDYVLEPAAAAARRGAPHEHAGGELSMPMTGLVVRVDVHEGQAVARGQVLLLVEAMKMEHTLRAPRDGVVRRLAAEAGKLVDGGAVLLEIAE